MIYNRLIVVFLIYFLTLGQFNEARAGKLFDICSRVTAGFTNFFSPKNSKPSHDSTNKSPEVSERLPRTDFEKLLVNKLGFEVGLSENDLLDKALDTYKKNYGDSRAVDIQVLRRVNDLESKIGFSRIWTGLFQKDLIKRGKVENFSTSSFDGLLYLPHPDGKSVTVYANYHDSMSPEEYISLANGGKAVVLSEPKIHQKMSAGQSQIFSALVRPYEEGETLKPGERIIYAPEYKMEANDGKFIVEPFKSGRETLGLVRHSNGTYELKMHSEYLRKSRMDTNQTFNFYDLLGAVQTAFLDMGWYNTSYEHGNGRLDKIEIPKDTPAEDREKFESHLARRIQDLKNFQAARNSRRLQIKIGADPNIATQAENSGFINDIDAYNALGIKKVDGSSTYFDSSPWHPNHPNLTKNGDLTYLSVDDRIYDSGIHLPGFDVIHKARTQPMVPVQIKNTNVYVVFYRAESAVSWSGYHEKFAVFANKELADKYIATHRFVRELRY